MRKETLKRSLERVQAARMQVESLKETARQIKPEYAADATRGSSPEFPYTQHRIRISGYSQAEYERLQEELRQKREYWMRCIRIAEHRLQEVEPEMQGILREYYINNRTQEEIATRSGYSRSAITLKISRYWKD